MSGVDDLSAGFFELASRVQEAIREQACRWRDCDRIGPFVASATPALHDDLLDLARGM